MSQQNTHLLNRTQICVPKAETSNFCQNEAHRLPVDTQPAASQQQSNHILYFLFFLPYVLYAKKVKGEETVIKLIGEPLNCFLLSALSISVFRVKLLYGNKSFEIIFKI